MGVGAQPTVAVYKLLSLVRTSHAHYRYTVLYMILCMAAVVNRGCLYSNSGVSTHLLAFARQKRTTTLSTVLLYVLSHIVPDVSVT